VLFFVQIKQVISLEFEEIFHYGLDNNRPIYLHFLNFHTDLI